MSHDPLRFTFGVHLHQPVGNHDSVFEDHVEGVYLPFLRRIAERGVGPIALHVSGPLLEWMQAHDARYLDLLGPMVSEGKVELLLAGFYEPVLAVLPREDRLEQIRWMRETLTRLFGVDPRGLWLTERVWEPGLAADLADAGVHFALVDDHHFTITGFPAQRLHAPFWTESGGKRVALFPIDQRLRYLVPFHSTDEVASYLLSLRAAGHRLAILADDGEKFGGWPGTRDRVYGGGWLDAFLEMLDGLAERGEVVLSSFAEALERVPSGGLAYLPAASYREMETWSLPTDAAIRLEHLEQELGAERVAGADGALIRGGHWRNFQVKYAESNRLHKKMLALTTLCRERGDPPDARRAVGRGQCNDAYWHGVFGGLYLPVLRQGVWRELARAEGLLRDGESLGYAIRDLDFDGNEEIWIHSSRFSAIVSPARGGAVEELTRFDAGTNYADTLTRRREAYHRLSATRHVPNGSASEAPSIHDIEQGLRVDELPPVDHEPRALFVDRVLRAELMQGDYERAAYEPLVSWARHRLTARVEHVNDLVIIELAAEDGTMRKRIQFDPEGNVTVSYRWTASRFAEGAYFASEISIAAPVAVHAPGADVWRFPIETIAKSERGLERTLQGESITARWPMRLGAGEVRIDLPTSERAALP